MSIEQDISYLKTQISGLSGQYSDDGDFLRSVVVRMKAIEKRLGVHTLRLDVIDGRLEDSSKGYPEFECECKRLRIENNSLKSAITKFKDVNGDLVSARNALGEMVDRLQVENKSLKAKNASLIANLRSRGYVSL